MRVLVGIVFFAVGLCSLEAQSSNLCADSGSARARLPKLGITLTAPAKLSEHRSSFKGVELDLAPGEVAAALLGEGYGVGISTYVSPPSMISSFAVCRNSWQEVGRIDFNPSGHASRLMFHAEYFFKNEITVREFADRVFRHYKVQPDEVEDDACFQDVTCFRGRTDLGENFLILRMDGAIRLHVRPLKPGE